MALVAVAFTPDSRRLLVGMTDSRSIVDLPHEGETVWSVRNLRGSTGSVVSAQITPDRRIAAIAVRRKHVTLWHLDETEPQPIELEPAGLFWQLLAVSPDSGLLAASAGPDIFVWHLNTPAAAPLRLSGHEEIVAFLAFSPDSQSLISGAMDNTIRRWDLNLESLMTDARQLVGRELTPEESKTYLPTPNARP
jgi:WD40 repeat protein